MATIGKRAVGPATTLKTPTCRSADAKGPCSGSGGCEVCRCLPPSMPPSAATSTRSDRSPPATKPVPTSLMASSVATTRDGGIRNWATSAPGRLRPALFQLDRLSTKPAAGQPALTWTTAGGCPPWAACGRWWLHEAIQRRMPALPAIRSPREVDEIACPSLPVAGQARWLQAAVATMRRPDPGIALNQAVHSAASRARQAAVLHASARAALRAPMLICFQAGRAGRPVRGSRM